MAQIPEVILKMIKIISEDESGTVRRFADLALVHSDVLVGIDDLKDRDAVEDLLDAAADDSGDLDQKNYAEKLFYLFSDFYPDDVPEEIGNFVKFTNTLKTYPDWGDLLNSTVDEKKAAEKSGGKPTIIKISITDKFPGLVGTYGSLLEQAYRAGCEAANSSKNAKLAFGQAFGSEIQKVFPKRKTDHIRKGGNSGKVREGLFFYDACAALILSDFTRLDPVIGDEACEARPSFIIDLWGLMMGYFKENVPFDVLELMALGYQKRHRNDSAKVSKGASYAAESHWSQQFLNLCDGCFGALPDGGMLREYVLLCYANTAASVLAEDEWGMASFDRDCGVYEASEKMFRRSDISRHSVTYIRKLARNLKSNILLEGDLVSECSAVLDTVNVIKFEKVEKKVFPIYSLPIYETMRTVLAHEYVSGRPVILSLYQFKCSPDGDIRELTCPATYTLSGVETIVYVPDHERGRFVPLSNTEWKKLNSRRPCLSLQAYHVLAEGSDIPVVDSKADFSTLGTAYIENMLPIDLSLLLQCYSAIHPIFPGGAQIGDDEENGTKLDPELALSYMEDLHKSACKTDLGLWEEDPTRRSKLFSLSKPICNLGMEYMAMRTLANICGVENKQYIKRLLGDDWANLKKKTLCARTLESCAFAIHHINTNSLEAVLRRNQNCLKLKKLPRFHEFDSKSSIDSLLPYFK